ncbi:hypothetical protein DUNSADRAFT_1669 [Dunaliella salina]|uniref:Encoded protein n=1 Tax=Dunaliella salina TaxID=3046 RepID=A0ABQ7FX73_DUNSA|nr:hypothetical protein DUNSADRAFT_1669 [Dunaliella salina]|eukprot:KAF5826955.1 hypothetical protein DUNSADRAFT_1669 [Dunaliella salina]
MCINSSSSVANTGRRRRPNRIWTSIMQPWRQQAAYLETEVVMYGMSLSWQSRRVLMTTLYASNLHDRSVDSILAFTVLFLYVRTRLRH